MEREEVRASSPMPDGGITKMEQSSIEGRKVVHKKAVVSDETTMPQVGLRNVTRVESNILEYVRKQMHRATATCEVIGAAVLFQEEMNTEMTIIEEHLMREEGFEQEEAVRSRW